MRPDDAVYLREDVRAEPLVNGFRAWAHLVAPHTYARNVVTKKLPMLRNAEEAALGHDRGRAGKIQALIRALADERPHVIEFGDAIAALDALMLDRANGFSLEPLYHQMPAALRGYVELCYDRYNHPSVRFLEGALYRSVLYDPTLQAVRLERTDPDLPGEGLSVPRLPEADRLVLPAPFSTEIWDHLGRARRAPVRAAQLADVLGLTVDQLRPYLTARPPGRLPLPAPSMPEAWFLNHACVLVRSPDTAVLLDPLVAYRYHGSNDRLSFADLPRLDCLAITHAHLDHLDIETLLQIRHLTDRVIVPRTGAGDLLDPSLKLVLEALGFPDVIELDEFAACPLPDGSVLPVPFLGEHSDLTVRGKSGYGITLGGRSCVFVADSQCLEAGVYDMARDLLGAVSAVYLGMECEGSPMTTAMGPYLPPGRHSDAMSRSRRTRGSNAADAIALVNALRPGRAYVYAMGLEPWLSYMFGVPDKTRSYSLAQADVFLSKCADLGIPARLLSGSQWLDF